LIEVLLVAGILAVLAALLAPRLFSQADEANRRIARAQVGRSGPIAKALGAYRMDMGKLPDTDEGLAALFQSKSNADEERYKGPYMEGTYPELKDPWGFPFEYKSPGDFNEDEYDLWSVGKDGKDDGGKEGSDDVKNWLEK
jgi:general secretion pathway protein G